MDILQWGLYKNDSLYGLFDTYESAYDCMEDVMFTSGSVHFEIRKFI